MDKLVPLDLPPGMRNTGTVYQSKDRWYDGNLVRFFQDTIQPVGGWESRSLTGATISGVPRAMITYRLNSGTQVIAIGTTTNLYAISGTVVYDITPAGFSIGGVNTTWHLDSFGSWLVAVAMTISSTGRAAGPAYYWTGDTSTDAVALDPFDGNAPTRLLSIVGTPERFMVGLGGIYTASGYVALGKNSEGLKVTWATQEGGFTGSEWVPSASNTAGDFELTTNGVLVCGKRGRGLTLLWTTTDLWTMTYIGGDFIFRFDQAANECGIIAPHAAVVTNVGAFWMGENGFFTYEGFVSPIPCDVQDYVFGSLNRTYVKYIWALENPAFGEVTWFYPSGAATEIDRYVTYNYAEKHWATGTLARTAGISQQAGTHTFPVMMGSDGTVYNHESGMNRGTSDPAYLESGPLEIEDGDRVISLQKVVPDDDTVGDVNLTIFTAPNPDTAETTNGPYTLSAQTSVRLKARQMRVKLTEVPQLANSAWGTATIATQTYLTAAYSPTLDIAVALGDNIDTATNVAAYSRNGSSWTATTAGTTAYAYTSVCWATDLSLFVAVGDSAGQANNALSSANGTSWTARVLEDDEWAVVYPATGGAIALGATKSAITSDGTTWTVSVVSGDYNTPLYGAYSATLGYSYAVFGSGILSRSADSIAWTEVNTGVVDTPRDVAVVGNRIIVLYGASIAYTDDGTTWTEVVIDEMTQTADRFVADDERDYIFTYNTGGTGEVFVSADLGVTWTELTGAPAGVDAGVFVSHTKKLSLIHDNPALAAANFDYPGVAGDWRVGTIRLGVQPSSRR